MAYTLLDKIYFIGKIYDDCSKVSQETGISLEFILAQTALESGWGSNVKGNNLFGIKADSSWTGSTVSFETQEYINGEWVTITDTFRAYDSYEESIEDWLTFLQNNPRYDQVFDDSVKGDLNKIAQEMQNAGYATDPNYASKIVGIANGKTMKKALASGSINNLPIMLSNLAIKALRSIFNAGAKQGSPIVLDLDKDGVETTALTSGTYFDHDNNGFAEQTGWASSDDGLLVMDRDADGLIEDGTELFGDNTLLANGTKASNGFQALKELDSNNDNKIDSTDAAYSQLKVWQDIDEDGYTSEGELKTLSELGIQSINTGYTNSTTVDSNGNSHKQISTFTWNDGTTNASEDVWFQQDKMFTIANDWVDVPEDIQALPDLQGFGTVYDLHQAMAKERLAGSETLKTLVEQFAAATDVNTRNNLTNQIIYKWTGVSTIDTTSRGSFIDARQLTAMETIFGEKFLQNGYSPNPGPGAAEVLKGAYAGLSELVYSQLMAQTHLKDLFSSITYTWDETTQSVKGDLSAAAVTIQTAITNDYNAGTALLSEFLKTTRTLGAEDMLDVKTFAGTLVAFNPSLAETIEMGGRNPIIGSGSLTGTYYSDALIGGTGNDTLNGSGGDDLLDGGAGNDYLTGGVGDDTYKFRRGYGTDTISDSDVTVGNRDTVEFGEGITKNDVEFTKEGSNLKVKINGTTDTLTISYWFNFSDGQYHIERFKFADGTVVTSSEIDAVIYKTYGTSAANTLNGAYVNEELYGYEGNDMLQGFAGDDLLDGGEGDDYMYGGLGNDTYIFGIGSGHDTISEYEADAATIIDTVKFGAGIASTDLELVKEGNNLKIKINGQTDTLTIQNWFSGITYRIEQFKFADGTTLTLSDIDAIGYKMYGTTANDSLSGSNVDDVINGYEGNDTLYGNEGNDILDGGIGNDTLTGGAGNDTYKYRLGDGSDTINDSDASASGGANIDTVEFGEGIASTDLEFVKEGNNLKIKINGTEDTLTIQYWFNPTTPANYRIEQFRFADGTTLTPEDIDATGYKMYGTTANESLSGSTANDEIYGYEGNDTLTGLEGDDTLIGGSGNDNLNGGAGNDTLDGGAGNDTMTGSTGSDTYKFAIGYGQDIINDYDTTTGNIDTIQFGEGIASTDLELVKEGNNLKILINGQTDTLLIQNWFYATQTPYRIEQFRFQDGTVLTINDIEQTGYKMYGTTANDLLTGSTAKDEEYAGIGADTLYGYAGDDVLNGEAGTDTLLGGEGNDILNGGADNDILNGEAGNDTLDGGIGNDTLNGGLGNDTYKFGIGSGSDTISDYATDYATTTDTVEFGTGITANDVEFVKEGINLKIKINGQTDTLLVQNWFSGANPNTSYRIEQFRFADGTTLTINDIEQAGYKMYGTTANDLLTGSNVKDEEYAGIGADTLYGYAGDDVLNGEAGTDYLYGGDGNDTLNGGADNDILNGEAGNDTLDGGTGNDTLNGGLGNDTYKFGIGSGADTINDSDATIGNIDTIEFGEGIASTDIEFVKEGNNLKIKINGQTDTLTIQYWFNAATPANYRIEQFKFADGTTLTINDIEQAGYKMYGTTNADVLSGSGATDKIYGYAGNDNLYGYAGNDTISGGIGADILYGGEGNDTLNGEADNDTLNGEAGNDTLDGGVGNDNLQGGLGNDTYKFEIGSGLDTINDYSTDSATTTDKVEMGANSLNLILTKTSNNLTITNNTNTDQITVQSWYSGAAYQTETIQTADGKHLHNNQVAQLIQAMATFCTTNGVTWNQAIEQKPTEVQQVLAQYWSQT